MPRVVSRLTCTALRATFLLVAIGGLCLGQRETVHASEPAASSPPSVDQLRYFMDQVKPILERHCLRCHGSPSNPKGGLRLTSRESILAGGESGPAVLLEKPDESLLIQAINYQGYEMPPSGKLPQAQIEILTNWARLGLPWPPGYEARQSSSEASSRGPPPVNEETKRFWSFRPVARPPVPAADDPQWGVNPIDAFVASKLAENGLKPNGPADRIALLRRAYYDLIGLPPEPEETASFLSDSSPSAFEQVIDRLLQSPHYGERWGRHWLDLVRYAETNSYERDGAKPFTWRYRDYVIRSLNEDIPYDQFIREQLAGDEFEPQTATGFIATGYYRLGIWDDEPADPLQALYDELDDMVQTTGQVFLGLTIGCARCHDHKLDPIPQQDYYRFLAFFRNVRRYGVRSHESVLDASVRTVPQEEDRKLYEEAIEAYELRLANVDGEIAAIESRVKPGLVGVEADDFQTEAARIEIIRKRVPDVISEKIFGRYQMLLQQREKLRNERPGRLAQALCVKESGLDVPPTNVFVRGNPHVPGAAVEPGFPSVLDPPSPEIVTRRPGAESSGRRLALANWIASADNPLTARVMVNRIWQHHFGRGIVRSSSDFGFQGAPPTHPELLDWLSAEFVSGGWRIKRIHKLIMLSRTYQMSSQAQPVALEKDPENNLSWRFNPRRLSAEEVRDSILAVNGTLNRGKMYGPSVYVKIPLEVLAGQSRPGDGWRNSRPEDENRRSIYIHVKRSLLTPVLEIFDAADTDSSCPVRFTTTQPTQALGMLNSELLQEQARAFATYVEQMVGAHEPSQVELVLRRVLQREPTPAETDRGFRFFNSMRTKHELPRHDALRHFCLAALNLNEFFYLD